MKSLFILFFLGLSSPVISQNIWGIEGKLHNGYLAVHRPTISHLPQERVFAGEVSYFLDLHKKKSWAGAYPVPRIGLTAFFSQTSNTPILGHLFGGFAFGDLPFFRNDKHSFSARVGSGLAVATKVYHPSTNPKNNAISAPVNVIVQMTLNYRRYFKLSEIGIGFGLNHFSNGANKLPNLGLNYPTLTLSYGKQVGRFGAKNEDRKYRVLDAYPDYWTFGANAVFSVKESFPTGGKKYPVYALNGVARRIYSPKLGVELVLDGIYKTAIMDYLPEYEKRPVDILQFGLFAGHVLTFDRFSTVLGMGGYFWDRYLPEDRFYHRIGMRYLFKNKVQIGITLKSNWGKADYVEWSLGYQFNRKKS